MTFLLNRSLAPFVGAMSMVLAGAASAAPVFSTGAVNNTQGAYNMSSSFTVSNAFTLAAGARITDFSFGLWLADQTTVNSLSWSIGSAFFGASVAGGTTSSYASTALPGSGSYSVFDIGVDIPDLDLAAGTYYLTLSGVSSPNGGMFWNSVAQVQSSLARQRSGSQELGEVHRGIFTLNGTALAVPEPRALELVAAALFAAGLASRRRFK